MCWENDGSAWKKQSWCQPPQNKYMWLHETGESYAEWGDTEYQVKINCAFFAIGWKATLKRSWKLLYCKLCIMVKLLFKWTCEFTETNQDAPRGPAKSRSPTVPSLWSPKPISQTHWYHESPLPLGSILSHHSTFFILGDNFPNTSPRAWIHPCGWFI